MGLSRLHPIPDLIPDRIGIAASGASVYHSVMDLMAEITCDEVLELAYDWLCRRRERTSHNNDVWDVPHKAHAFFIRNRCPMPRISKWMHGVRK